MKKLIINSNQIEDEYSLKVNKEYLKQLEILMEKDENIDIKSAQKHIEKVKKDIKFIENHLSNFGYIDMTPEEIEDYKKSQQQYEPRTE